MWSQSCPTFCNPIDCSPPDILSVGFSRQEYWVGPSGLPFPTPGDLPELGIEPESPVSPALEGRFFFFFFLLFIFEILCVCVQIIIF